jgi:hypothetical protein
MRILRRAWCLFLLALATPSASIACSVCQGGTADNRIEFIGTTALLTFLPLLLIGGVVFGLRRRYLSLAQQETREDVPRIPRADAARATTSS